MTHHNEFDWGPSDELGAMIEKISHDEPRAGLTNRVMNKLEPRRPSWLAQFVSWLTTPFSLSMSPVTASAAVLILVVSGSFLFKAPVSDQPPAFISGQGKGPVPVVFRLQEPTAQSVSVIGTFNHWNPKGYEMVQESESGTWSIRVDLSPGKHDYVFLVDGKEFTPDPQADISKADDFGHQNSILFVKGRNGQEI